MNYQKEKVGPDITRTVTRNVVAACALRIKTIIAGYRGTFYSNDKLHVLTDKQRKLYTFVKNLDCAAFS